MRDILVTLRAYENSNNKVYLDMLLDTIKTELENKKHYLEYELKEVDSNLELLENIKRNIESKEV